MVCAFITYLSCFFRLKYYTEHSVNASLAPIPSPTANTASLFDFNWFDPAIFDGAPFSNQSPFYANSLGLPTNIDLFPSSVNSYEPDRASFASSYYRFSPIRQEYNCI